MHPVAMALYVGADPYKPIVDKVQAGVELVCCTSFVGVSTPPPRCRDASPARLPTTTDTRR